MATNLNIDTNAASNSDPTFMQQASDPHVKVTLDSTRNLSDAFNSISIVDSPLSESATTGRVGLAAQIPPSQSPILTAPSAGDSVSNPRSTVLHTMKPYPSPPLATGPLVNLNYETAPVGSSLAQNGTPDGSNKLYPSITNRGFEQDDQIINDDVVEDNNHQESDHQQESTEFVDYMSERLRKSDEEVKHKSATKSKSTIPQEGYFSSPGLGGVQSKQNYQHRSNKEYKYTEVYGSTRETPKKSNFQDSDIRDKQSNSEVKTYGNNAWSDYQSGNIKVEQYQAGHDEEQHRQQMYRQKSYEDRHQIGNVGASGAMMNSISSYNSLPRSNSPNKDFNSYNAPRMTGQIIPVPSSFANVQNYADGVYSTNLNLIQSYGNDLNAINNHLNWMYRSLRGYHEQNDKAMTFAYCYSYLHCALYAEKIGLDTNHKLLKECDSFCNELRHRFTTENVLQPPNAGTSATPSQLPGKGVFSNILKTIAKNEEPVIGVATKYWRQAYGGDLPAKSVQGGYNNKELPLYVCRIHHKNSILPGKFIYDYGKAFSSYNNEVIEDTTYEILCDRDVDWFKFKSKNQIPKTAIIAGIDLKTKQPLYVGRYEHGKSMTVGKVDGFTKKLHVVYLSREHIFEEFEILLSTEPDNRIHFKDRKQFLDKFSDKHFTGSKEKYSKK